MKYVLYYLFCFSILSCNIGNDTNETTTWIGKDYFWGGVLYVSSNSKSVYINNNYGIYKTDDSGITWIETTQTELNNFTDDVLLDSIYTEIYNSGHIESNNAIEDIVIGNNGSIFVAVYCTPPEHDSKI